MGDEELEAVKKQLAAMKKIEAAGFTNTEIATDYFQEKEAILEGIVKTLETVTVTGNRRNRSPEKHRQKFAGRTQKQGGKPQRTFPA
jgi:hypothetical protein